MNQLIFTIILALMLLLIYFLNKKFALLRDVSSVADDKKKPYSYSRVQLAWWTWIIISSFIAVIISNGGVIPTLDSSTLLLLGISAGTTTVASMIDVSDADKARHQNIMGKNLLYDIIDDSNGASIHRLQAVLFNIIFGVWMIITVYNKMDCVPAIDTNSLLLLGISAGTYSLVKTSENKMANTSGNTTPPSNS